MEDDEKYVKLFQYVTDRLQAIEDKVDGTATKDQVDHVYQAIDGMLKQLQTNEQERAVLDNQLVKYNRWFDQLAHKANVKLIP